MYVWLADSGPTPPPPYMVWSLQNRIADPGPADPSPICYGRVMTYWFSLIFCDCQSFVLKSNDSKVPEVPRGGRRASARRQRSMLEVLMCEALVFIGFQLKKTINLMLAKVSQKGRRRALRQTLLLDVMVHENIPRMTFYCFSLLSNDSAATIPCWWGGRARNIYIYMPCLTFNGMSHWFCTFTCPSRVVPRGLAGFERSHADNVADCVFRYRGQRRQYY